MEIRSYPWDGVKHKVNWGIYLINLTTLSSLGEAQVKAAL